MNPASNTLGDLFLKRQEQLQESLYGEGWNDCKRKVLEILKKDWSGLDLSVNSCDKYYIEKIEKL